MGSHLKVFVYGTLKPGECNYPLYCGGKVREKIRAFTYGNLYYLGLGYPAMTEGKAKVEGYLLTFADENVLEQLDRLEDYHPLRSLDENEYLRQRIPVYTIAGEGLGEAWGYQMTLENVHKYHGKLLPSGWWTGNR